MICNKCGAQVTDGSLFCSKCGAKIEETPVKQAVPEVKKNEPDPVKAHNYSVASLVMGILSMLFPSFVMSILAIVFGSVSGKANGRRKNGMAVAGFTLGWVSLALSIVFVVLVCLFVVNIPVFVVD